MREDTTMEDPTLPPQEDYPLTLGDLDVNDTFEMWNYTDVYRVVQLPEEYDIGRNRWPILREIEFAQMYGYSPTIIHVSRDGDGIHRPILGPDGKVFFMAHTKPVRRTPWIEATSR